MVLLIQFQNYQTWGVWSKRSSRWPWWSNFCEFTKPYLTIQRAHRPFRLVNPYAHRPSPSHRAPIWSEPWTLLRLCYGNTPWHTVAQPGSPWQTASGRWGTVGQSGSIWVRNGKEAGVSYGFKGLIVSINHRGYTILIICFKRLLDCGLARAWPL
jgi:hypothetical protein